MDGLGKRQVVSAVLGDIAGITAAVAADAEGRHIAGAAERARAALVRKLAADSEVELAVVDARRTHYSVPNDPLFAAGPLATGPAVGQWYLRAPDAQINWSTRASGPAGGVA